MISVFRVVFIDYVGVFWGLVVFFELFVIFRSEI